MRWLLVVALLAFAAGAASADPPCATDWVALGDEDGIGGTGLVEEEDGIGGTGLAGDEDGIGGTGVLGAITGFASICVNGIEIEYSDAASVTANGSPAAPGSLALGQVVWVVANARPGEGGRLLQAVSIDILTPIAGPVDAVYPDRRILVVAGETVLVPEAAVVFGRVAGALAVEPGRFVQVSGLRRADGTVVASRIDEAAPPTVESTRFDLWSRVTAAAGLTELSLEGWAREDGQGRIFVGGVQVDTGQLASGRLPASGSRVRVRGALGGAILRARSIEVPSGSGALDRLGAPIANAPMGASDAVRSLGDATARPGGFGDRTIEAEPPAVRELSVPQMPPQPPVLVEPPIAIDRGSAVDGARGR